MRGVVEIVNVSTVISKGNFLCSKIKTAVPLLSGCKSDLVVKLAKYKGRV